MQIREREKLETIHLYVVREDDQHTPPVWLSLIPPIILLCLLVVVGVLYPYHPPLIRETIRVPAILLPLRSFSAQIAVIPTGVKTYPATYATGILTITNGSILAEHLPVGMIFTAANGVEVMTTASVDIPAGNGTSYGGAYVSAKAVSAGSEGNIASLTINQVYGTSLYIKNSRAFTGGKDAHSLSVITPQDRQQALAQARATLIQQTFAGLL